MEIQIPFHHLRWCKWKHRRFLSRWKTSFGWYWIRFQIHSRFIHLNHCWSFSQHRCWKYWTRLFYLCFDLVYLVLVLLWDFLLSKILWWFLLHLVVRCWWSLCCSRLGDVLPFWRSWNGSLSSSIFSSSFVTYLRVRDTEYRRSFNLLNFIRKNYVYIPLVLSAFYSFTNIVLF